MTVSRPFLLIVGLFVMALVVSHIVAVKLVGVWDRVFGAGTLLFPLTYLLGDVLREVYGYRQARLVIWIGFLANFVAVGAIQLALALPAADFWEEYEAAYETVFGTTWCLFLASLPPTSLASF